jgi:hypothetical protein
MCRATACRTCGKVTWAGCGQHVAQVKATIPNEQWCNGHPKSERASWIKRVFAR